MNSTRATPVPPRGPDCASFAPRLPLAGQRLLPAEEATRLRAHVATCAHCQALLAAYDRLDAALGRRFATPLEDLTALTEEIMDQIAEQKNPFPPAPFAPARTAIPARGSARRISLIAGVAAALAIAVLAATLLASRGLATRGLPLGGPLHSRATPTPGGFGPVIQVHQLVMLAPNDGWAFATYNTAACALPPAPPLTPGTSVVVPACKHLDAVLHYDGHSWSRASIPGAGTILSVSSPPGAATWAVAATPTNSGGDGLAHRWLGSRRIPAKSAARPAQSLPLQQWRVGEVCARWTAAPVRAGVIRLLGDR